MKRLLIKLAILASVLILAVGCTSSNSTSSKAKNENVTPVSSNDNGKNADPGSQDNKKGEKTVRTYLENEFTGPNEELSNIFKIKDFETQAAALNKYIDKNYKDLIAENKYQTFINVNQILRWLTRAHQSGYQLNPQNIELQKVENYNAYTFKVDVKYSKGGKTNTTTVTGYINLNDRDKISDIRDVKDNELVQIMLPPHPKEN